MEAEGSIIAWDFSLTYGKVSLVCWRAADHMTHPPSQHPGVLRVCCRLLRPVRVRPPCSVRGEGVVLRYGELKVFFFFLFSVTLMPHVTSKLTANVSMVH